MAESGKSSSLSVWVVLLAAVAGIIVGLFLGDYAGVLRPIGTGYAMLLGGAVYPYLICSLLLGLGRMAPGVGWRLFQSGWRYYLGLWIVTFAVLWALSWGIAKPLPVGLRPEVAGSAGPSLLSMLIPSDPFAALSSNYVPAVILFCFAFGIALQHVKEKETLLSMLESLRLTCLTFWKGVVPFAPVAVFSLFAAEAGTLRFSQIESIGVFFLLFFAGSLGLALWILPMILSALTPLKSKETINEVRSAFMVALVTTLSVAALPFITEATKRLGDRAGINDQERDEVIRTNISVAYPLGQLGNFFVYLFILFAASFYGVSIQPMDSWLLPVISLASCIGSPTSSVSAVQFLSSWLHLPDTVTSFYVGLMAFTRYGQVIASVAGFAFLSFTVMLSYYGKIHLRIGRLLAVVAVGLAVMLGVGLAGRKLSQLAVENRSNPYLEFSVTPQLRNSVKTIFGTDGEPPVIAGEAVMVRIQRTGELRVGYNDSIIPYCYRNAAGELTGFDVAYAYRLAADLNVNLRFVRFEWTELEQDLLQHQFDIAMAGIYVTEGRLMKLTASTPYYQSPLALFLPRARAGEFRSRAEIEGHAGLRIGVFNDPVLLPRVKRTFPNAEIVMLPGYATMPDFTKIDAAIWTFVQAEALAAAHPEIVAVEPANGGNPYLFAYLMPPDSTELESFVDYWLHLKASSGFEQEQRDYWIQRIPRTSSAPRWSILRNVLGWVK